MARSSDSARSFARSVEFPRLADRSDRFPVTSADRLVSVVEPPDRFVTVDLIACKSGDETFPRGERSRGGDLCSGEFEQSRDDVDNVAGSRADFSAGGDPGRPREQQRSSDTALVRPGFVAAEGRVANRRPAGSEAEVGARRTGRLRGIVPVVAHHNLGTGAVVGEEKDKRVLPFAHRFDLVNDPPDLQIHAVYHRGMDRHLAGLELLLFICQGFPRERFIDFAVAEDLEIVRKMVGRSEVGFGAGKCPVEEPEFAHFFPTLRPHRLPTRGIGVLVKGDVLRQGVEGKVGRGKGEVVKKRSTVMIGRMIPQHLDSMIGEGDGAIVAGSFFHRR